MDTRTGRLTSAGTKLRASPEAAEAIVSAAPPIIIWMPAETGFESGRGRCRDQIVPTAQATVPASNAKRAVTWIRSLDKWFGVRLSAATPPRPQTVPIAKRTGTAEPERLHSNPAIHTGMRADMIAATPEGTRCSAQNSGP